MSLTSVLKTKMDRRRVLGNLGMMGAGAALTACSVGFGDTNPNQDDYDAAILNFALNLEYLEAAFYLAAVGRITELPNYSASKIILPSGFDGKTTISFDNESVGEYAAEIAQDELDHVEFLLSALGNNAAGLPTIDLTGSFVGAATVANSLAAGGLGFDPADFNPFAAEAFFVHGAYIFEDVGVTAYSGAAPLITNKTFLAKAAGIMAVEAYHAGEIRTLLYNADMRRGAIYGQLDTWKIANAISATRDFVDQGRSASNTDLDQGIVAEANFGLATQAHGGANIIPTDSNGIAFARTPRQVANIVFLSGDNTKTSGGFFPNGLSVPTGLEDDFSYLLSL
ncbi:MAG: ferritin-like domain-containing protein [Deinococcales bacterium]